MSDIPDGSDPWLVVIDMQAIFASYPEWWGCPDFDSIVGPIQKLASKFGSRTLLTRFAPGSHGGSWGPYYRQSSFADVPGSNPLYDIVGSLSYLATADNIVTMSTFSKWGDEQLGVRAKTGEYPHLVLTGVATDCCVLSTAMAAAEAGAFVTVVLDACAGSSAVNQLAAGNILQGYAPLISVKSSLEVLGT